MVSKVDECNSAPEICKSVDVLQAMTWNDISETTIVKCCTKTGILDSEGKTNAVTPQTAVLIYLPTLDKNSHQYKISK